MKQISALLLSALLASTAGSLSACGTERANETNKVEKTKTPKPEPTKLVKEPITEPVMTNLVKTTLAEHDQLEVVVSHVVLPANFELPKHYHPGQEFIYVQEGTLTMKVKDKPDMDVKAGEVFVVPPRAIHTAIANEQVTAVVFRVHDKDQPVRIIIKPNGEEVPVDR